MDYRIWAYCNSRYFHTNIVPFMAQLRLLTPKRYLTFVLACCMELILVNNFQIRLCCVEHWKWTSSVDKTNELSRLNDRVLFLCENKLDDYKDTCGSTTSRRLSNIVCFMVVKRYIHICFVICPCYTIVTVISTWWLLLAWCLFWHQGIGNHQYDILRSSETHNGNRKHSHNFIFGLQGLA